MVWSFADVAGGGGDVLKASSAVVDGGGLFKTEVFDFLLVWACWGRDVGADASESLSELDGDSEDEALDDDGDGGNASRRFHVNCAR